MINNFISEQIINQVDLFTISKMRSGLFWIWH